ncbi:hypothetical protein KAFR_0A00410 [Kazachstania africana CBS 2517]|uniref:histone acetyltransferase n=1 Tax=Kazachstania africana (strain ATCC 22294 / BCRC 22015 / CBS 2517 / CECT 1963 / NBRC 1671 / NRRL Y-8276) TaxID=1071382 RepID=H2AM79_KAZAF|nr:hypothetical protein KAFR_0A00410 [Kazachstania africana CBS 2517]CCF55479.1 hypothetical protein KAFR_0A00410 [Kazachstania africana CBS 2517]
MPGKKHQATVAGGEPSKLKVKKRGKKKTFLEKDHLYGILEKRNINRVKFGVDKVFDTWYGSNVYFNLDTLKLGCIEDDDDDDEHNNVDTNAAESIWLDTLYVCEYCFKYTDNNVKLMKHSQLCSFKRKAPGRIKYKSPEYTIRRVKGSKHKLFCQCLCLFTKLFLDNKSMFFRLDNYDFYILYETGSTKPMGFFSKDLVSYNQNNLACILVFPPYQRRNLGTLLIEFSYKLSKLDSIVSGPEVPLSPFGLISYLKVWSQLLCYHLLEGDLTTMGGISLKQLSSVTGLRINDIIMTLKHLNCIGDDNKIYLSILRTWMNKHGKNGFMVQDEYLLLDD